MSTLLALDGWSARTVAVAHLVGGTVEATVRLTGASIARTASLAAGGRTWSVAVMVVCAATWLRAGEHLGDTAFCTVVGGALTAVTTRTIVHAVRRPSPSGSAVQASADTDAPTSPGV